MILPGVWMLAAIACAFFISAAAGLGGSLVLVPVLTLALGPKEGIGLAALLLAGNNLVKLWVYRRVLPVRPAAIVAGCSGAGALLGARLLIAAPERAVDAAVIISLAMALLAESREARTWRRSLVPLLAATSGATSGFAGTSGPLKGAAVRSLGLDRMHTIGAAAIVSAVSDVIKTVTFGQAGLLGATHIELALVAVPLMVLATQAGRQFTLLIGEKGYTRLFWFVVGGYAVRLML